MSLSRTPPRPIRLGPVRKRDVRTQFGALCWRMHKDRLQVLLVTTRETRRWVVPKGWPVDGATPAAAAATEAFEEGGVSGAVEHGCIGIYTYIKDMRGADDLPCVVAVFPLRVAVVHKAWPEASERRRRWATPKKAARLVTEPELARLIRDFEPGHVAR